MYVHYKSLFGFFHNCNVTHRPHYNHLRSSRVVIPIIYKQIRSRISETTKPSTCTLILLSYVL